LRHTNKKVAETAEMTLLRQYCRPPHQFREIHLGQLDEDAALT